MTYQKRYNMAFRDISALRFICSKCGTVISMPIAKNIPPVGCPVCPDMTKWFDIKNEEYVALKEFLASLIKLKARSEGAACDVRLEVESPE